MCSTEKAACCKVALGEHLQHCPTTIRAQFHERKKITVLKKTLQTLKPAILLFEFYHIHTFMYLHAFSLTFQMPTAYEPGKSESSKATIDNEQITSELIMKSIISMICIKALDKYYMTI